MKNKLFAILIKIFFILVSVITAFIILELFTRLFFYDKIVLFPRYHTEATYGEYKIRRMQPNLTFYHTSLDGKWKFNINKQGYRSHYDYNYDKNKKLRILCLGDSHTLGYEVSYEQTYPYIVETYLSMRGYSVEVMNVGVSGFSNAEELVYLENEGVKYKPDIVVLGFYANDIEDNFRTGLFSLTSTRQLVAREKTYLPGVEVQKFINRFVLFRWLNENSFFYSLFINTVQDVYKAKLNKEAREQYFEFALPTKDDYYEHELELTAAILSRMAAFSKRNNSKFYLVDIPSSKGSKQFISSLPKSLLGRLENEADFILLSEYLFSDYSGIMEMHVEHGHHHISPFSHALIGVHLAKKVMQDFEK